MAPTVTDIGCISAPGRNIWDANKQITWNWENAFDFWEDFRDVWISRSLDFINQGDIFLNNKKRSYNIRECSSEILAFTAHSSWKACS